MLLVYRVALQVLFGAILGVFVFVGIQPVKTRRAWPEGLTFFVALAVTIILIIPLAFVEQWFFALLRWWA